MRQFDPQGQQDDPSKNEAWLINNTLMKMRDAEANRNWHSMWVHFKFAFNRQMIYFREETRKLLDADWKEMVKLEEKIKTLQTDEKSEVSQVSKEKYLELLHLNFMETHMAYVFYALPRWGIVEVQGEGTFDYSKHDFDELAAIINEKHVSVSKAITDNRKEDIIELVV